MKSVIKLGDAHQVEICGTKIPIVYVQWLSQETIWDMKLYYRINVFYFSIDLQLSTLNKRFIGGAVKLLILIVQL